MTRRVALSACIGTLILTTPAFAHHPGGGGNAGGAGPVVTIPATTLEEGHFSMAVWYEYVRLGGLSDAGLIDAAANHIHAHSIKTIESAVAAFAYGVTDNFMIALRAPINRRSDIREGHHSHGPEGNTVDNRGDSTGFGDVTLLGQWRFLNNIAAQTQAAVLFGIKAPTGTTNLFDQNGELFETEFQPGSGSWDWLLGAAFSQRFGSWSFDSNVLYIGAGKGAQETNLGDRFLYNAALSYRLFGASSDPRNAQAHAGHSHGKTPIRKAPAPVEAPQSWVLDAVLELNGEWHAKQKVAGEIDDNSGGNTIYIAPGLRASYGRFSSFVSVGIPIVNNLNGLQSKPDYRVLTGMSFAY
jgi:outer membrane putative beta-barrel porin/alpha-amylase